MIFASALSMLKSAALVWAGEIVIRDPCFAFAKPKTGRLDFPFDPNVSHALTKHNVYFPQGDTRALSLVECEVSVYYEHSGFLTSLLLAI